MLVIRMQRTGRKGHAQFRVIVQDKRRTPTSGKIVAQLGSYNPHAKQTTLDKEKASFYLEHGAQPSERVARLLKAEGVKLPAWVVLSSEKQRTVRNADKRRSTRPAEETPPEEPAAETASEEPVAPAAEAASVTETAAEDAPTEPAIETAEAPEETTPEAAPEAEAPAKAAAEDAAPADSAETDETTAE